MTNRSRYIIPKRLRSKIRKMLHYHSSALSLENEIIAEIEQQSGLEIFTALTGDEESDFDIREILEMAVNDLEAQND